MLEDSRAAEVITQPAYPWCCWSDGCGRESFARPENVSNAGGRARGVGCTVCIVRPVSGTRGSFDEFIEGTLSVE